MSKQNKNVSLSIKEFRNLLNKIESLNKKIDYLEELDRKNFLQLITLQNKVFDYERNFIEYYKYEELRYDYMNALQEVINNKKKEGKNEI